MIHGLYLVNAYKLRDHKLYEPRCAILHEKKNPTTNSFPILDMINWLILKYILSYRLHVCGDGYEVLMLVTELD